MHKFFAKTRFLGKNIISLTECHSTNDFLIALAKNEGVENGTIVQTDSQSMGRGQRGNTWESAPGENLLFSVYIHRPALKISEQYLVNVAVSLALHTALSDDVKVADVLQVKWPNDLYLNNKKVAGILVEASIISQQLEWLIIGVGLNTTQTQFSYPMATSLVKEGIDAPDPWIIMENFCIELEPLLSAINDEKEALMASYYAVLRWKSELRTFQSSELGIFQGTIQGLDDRGRILLDFDGKEYAFDIKELKFIS